MVLLAACEEAPPERYLDGDSRPAAATESSKTTATVLDPAGSASLDRQLGGGETHAYAIDLAIGQVLDVQVEQHGVDVVAELRGPEEQDLLQVDNPSGAAGTVGPERVFWVAEASGQHRLTIRALGGLSSSGRYTIRSQPVRAAEPDDVRRAAAERAKARADVLAQNRMPPALLQAAGEYGEALAGFRALDDDARQADTHFGLGEVWKKLNKGDQAEDEYGRALSLYQATGNLRQQALVLNQSCHLQIYQSARADLALEPCLKAVDLWPVVKDRLGLAKSSNNLGVVYRQLHEYQRALIFYDQALAIWEEIGRHGEEAKTLNNRGRLYLALGDYRQAVADLERALEMRRALGGPHEIAEALYSLGVAYARWNVRDAARRRFEEALNVRPKGKDRTTGNLLLGHGLTLAGEDALSALKKVRQARETFRESGSLQGEAVSSLAMGRILNSQGHYASARDHLTEALQIFESIRDFSGQAETRLALGDAKRGLGRFEPAKRETERALAIVEDLRASVTAGGELRASFFATKQVYYERYIDLLMELHSRQPAGGYQAEALAASERARARSLIEALSDRRDRLRQHADRGLLEQEAGLKRQIYAQQAHIQQFLGRPGADPEAVAKLELEQQDLLRRYEKLQGQIRISSPRTADLTRPHPLSVEEIQQRLLEDGTLLLEYKLGASRSFVWAVTATSITVKVLPKRADIEHAAELTYRRIAENKTVAKSRVQRHLAELSQILLAPVEQQLKQARRLLIVADGALQYLPFDALPLPGIDLPASESAERSLTPGVDVVYLPSASTLAFLRDQVADRKPVPRLLAVLADPVSSASDPRLSRPGSSEGEDLPELRGVVSADTEAHPRLVHSGLEAATILGLVPDESRFAGLGFAASRDALTSGELGRYRILHFATHGDLSSKHAGLSRLVLSRFDAAGQPRHDGFWYAYEISDEDLPAELVVLSACQTALGEPIRGEGLVGLTHGFMNAGAPRVIVSLWRVDDRATAALMGRFYENLLRHQLAPPAALRGAKQYIREHKRWQAPYFWAGFVLQGEWRDIAR